MNCASGATNVTLARAAYSGSDVQDDPCVGAELCLHGVLSRQVDLHVHIAEVDQGEDLAAAA